MLSFKLVTPRLASCLQSRLAPASKAAKAHALTAPVASRWLVSPMRFSQFSLLHTSSSQFRAAATLNAAKDAVSSQIPHATSNLSAKLEGPLHNPTTSASQLGVGDVPRAAGLGKPRVVSSKSVAYWLLFCGAAVFGIVVLGGLTRLTESGLSITEWKPITGTLPPMNEADWEHQFELYKESPEFKELNAHMTLEEYKFIYFMEWGHRLWGRAIGMLVLLPGAYFVWKGRTSPQTNRRLLGISALLALQGLIGWWMVYSGLDRKNLDSRADTQPRVSHYRLATHLGAAFLLYFAMTATGLGILKQHRYLKAPAKAMSEVTILSSSLATWPRRFAVGLLLLGFVTSVSGCFVAGLDAGLLYNTFPMMGRGITPSTNELFDKRYTGESDPDSWTLFYKNVLDNPVTVQLGHRILAVTTWTACLAYFLYARKRRALLPRSVYKGAHGVIGFATLQAALGITTLVYVVPIHAAALHQAGALAFLTSILVLLNRLRVPRPQIKKLLKLMAESVTRKTSSKTA